MFVIDNITIIVSGILVLLAIIVPFINVLVLRLKEDKNSSVKGQADVGGDTGGTEKKPGISVVIAVDDEGDCLKNNLPSWLEQEYDGDYQIIVVVCANDELIENTLKKYSSDKHLYTTFIPASSRYMSRRKLAITIGTKAAKHDWILLTDVDTKPVGKGCLQKISSNCSTDTDIVLGYSSLDSDYKSVRRFDYTYDLYRQLAKAERGKAWGYCGNLLLFRKTMFINGKGFDGNLKYIRGEYDYIVNKFSTQGNTVVDMSDEAALVQDEPTEKSWRNKNLYYMSTRKRLKGAKTARLFYNTTMWLMWLEYLLIDASLLFSILTDRWIITIAAAASFVVTLMLRAIVMKRSIRRYLDDMSYIKMLWFEAMMPLRKLSRMIKYGMADKYDFICHKI